MDLSFEQVFRIPILTLNICRAHPFIEKNFRWFLPFFIVHGVYYLYIIQLIKNILFIDLRTGDFRKTCQNGTICCTMMSASFQYGILLWKSKYITNLFHSVMDDYKRIKELTLEEQEIVFKYAKKSMWFGQMWCYLAVIGVIAFPVKNVILHTYYFCISEFHWIHLYDITYPAIINDNKENRIIFCILYIMILVYSSYNGLIFCSFSPLGPNFMLHGCGQLEILTKRVERLFSNNRSLDDILIELKSIAVELQKNYDFVDNIQNAFRVAYEFIMKVTSIVLPITVYQVIEATADGDMSVEFIVFIIGSMVISSSPCYYSEMIMEKGEMFRMAVYTCGWERTWDRRTRTMILLLLQRASRPVAICTIFKTLCLDTLTDVYRQSYTIFNLINAMWN